MDGIIPCVEANDAEQLNILINSDLRLNAENKNKNNEGHF